jgi:type IV pilus assembly protein PilO
MNQLVENFLERPTSHKMIAWVGSAALLVIVFYLYFYKGELKQFGELKEKGEKLEDQIFEQQQLARKLPQFKKEVEALDKKLELVLLQLPDRKEIDSLLSSISALAEDTGLEVLKFAPADEQIREFYAEVPVAVELEGTFHQIATFFDEVGHLPRIVNIDGVVLDILTETKQEVLIRANLNVRTYRYLDPNERAAAAAPVDPKNKQGRRKRKAT